MAAKGLRMTGKGSWWTAFSKGNQPTCTAATKVNDDAINRIVKRTVNRMTWKGLVLAFLLQALFVLLHVFVKV